MHIIKEYQLEQNKVLRVILDEDAESPNKWNDQNVFLVLETKEHTIKRKGFNPINIKEHLNHIETLRKYEYDQYIIFNVYSKFNGTNEEIFINSSGEISGFILIKKSEILNDPKCTNTRFINKKAKELALNLIRTWNQYLSGQIYGYSIVEKIMCSHCKHIEINLGDSAYGFYGNDNPRSNGMLEQIGLKIIE